MKVLTDGFAPMPLVEEPAKEERIIPRDPNTGMFASRKDVAPSPAEIKAATIAKLTDASTDGKSIYERSLENVAKNAALNCEVPCFDKKGSPILGSDGKQLTVYDSKLAMSCAKSLDSISKLMGLPHKEEPKFGHDIKIVIIKQDPNGDILARQNGIILELKAREPMQPSWIDAEVVSTDPAPLAVPKPVGRTGKVHKEQVDVEWMYQNNALKYAQETKLMISAVRAKAANELPLRISKTGEVMQGWYRLADASSQNQSEIEALIEEE